MSPLPLLKLSQALARLKPPPHGWNPSPEFLRSAKANIIIGQEPAAGEKLVTGDILKLFIPDILTEYPDFLTQSPYKDNIDEIQKFCDEYDIHLTVKEVETEDKTQGTILSQSKSATSNISKGDEIEVEVAKKPVVLEPLDGESGNSENEQNNQDN